MKKTTLFRGALLFAAVAFCAVAANAQILWKISGNGAKDSYILGSHHVAPMSVLDGIAGFNDAFASCQQMYGEIDMESATQDMVMQSQKYMMAPADSTLSKVLTADQLAIVDAAMQKYVRMSVAQLDKVSPVKPAVISAQIAVLQAYDKLKLWQQGYDLVYIGRRTLPTPAFDIYLQSMTKDAGGHVHIYNQVDYDELKLWYGAASLFIYPALAEGFGIPPIEAGAAGVPCICNNKTAMADFIFFGKNLIDVSAPQVLHEAILSNISDTTCDTNGISNVIRKTYNWQAIASLFYQKLKENV